MRGFSAHVFGTRVPLGERKNVDNLLVGRYVGAASLGAYSLAFNLMVTPVTRVADSHRCSSRRSRGFASPEESVSSGSEPSHSSPPS